MKLLSLLLALLCLGTNANAEVVRDPKGRQVGVINEEEHILDSNGRIMKIWAGPGVVLKEEQYGYSATREEPAHNPILDEVDREIEYGNTYANGLILQRSEVVGGNRIRIREDEVLVGIAHYLKALVLIERYKLRKEEEKR